LDKAQMAEESDPKKKASTARHDAPGDEYNLSGDFRGAVINIKSTLVSNDEVKDFENLPPEPGEPPFQGLQYFDEKDADRFFGREMLVAKIVTRMSGTRFLAVIGASGSGKSSVVRAGVIPALRRGARLADGGMPPTDSGQWDIRVFTPSAHPLEALSASLTRDSESVTAASTLRADMEQDVHALVLAARRLLSQNGRKHLLLVIDQFEEIFTQCKQESERQAFLENLLMAVDPSDSQPVSVLLTLRADFYAQLSRTERLRELVSQNQEFIGAMNSDELTRAILQPAALGNWKVQAGLVEVLLDDLGSEPGELPLLSHALLETWKRRRGRVMTVSGYTETGGVHGAIAQTAETVFRQRLTSAQQPIARMIFIKLAEMGDSSLDTRRQAPFSELITRATDEAAINTVLGILTDARLVTTGTQDPGDVRVVEVAHEALIREWPTLRDWLNQNREGLILHRQLTEDVNDWIKLGRDTGALYRGARLQQTLEWAKANVDLISLTEQEFLDASRKIAREEGDQTRRLSRARWVQIALGGSAVLLVIAVAVVYLAANGFFTPVTMKGIFNIAVAEFGEMGADGQIRESNIGQQISGWAVNYLREAVTDDPNILVWPFDGNIFNRTRVALVTPETAEVIAHDINAHLLLYGYVDTRETPAQLVLKFWIAPQAKYRFEDIQGSFSVGDPIRVVDMDNPGISVQSDLGKQASALAWIGIGLAQEQEGNSEDALRSFQRAVDLAPQSEVLQFFLGREYLFLTGNPTIYWDEYMQAAEEAFKNSISLNDRYARAYIGLGSVYLKQAAMMQDIAVATEKSVDPQVAEWAQKSIDAYQTVLDLKPNSEEYGNPVQDVARLGLGNAYRLKGTILYYQEDYPSALDSLNRAIQILDEVRPGFEKSAQDHVSHKRYLAQTYEYLGEAYEWQGIIHVVNMDNGQALVSYKNSMDYFNKCIAEGDATPDLIIQDQIVEKYCRPNYEASKRMYESIKGDQ
jgi:tetratricopeptide (TPR) repeat protein